MRRSIEGGGTILQRGERCWTEERLSAANLPEIGLLVVIALEFDLEQLRRRELRQVGRMHCIHVCFALVLFCAIPPDQAPVRFGSPCSNSLCIAAYFLLLRSPGA